MFRVRLLAGTSIEGPNGALNGAVLQRHRFALLALLAGAPQRTLSRDKLVAYLWPESDEARARHLLRSALHTVRQALGEEAILSSGDDLRLNPELITTDVGEFLDRLERADVEGALALYAGPFLDGFHLNDAPELERWIDVERERLERLRRAGLQRLAERAEQRRDFAEAVEWLRKLAAADPYNSRVALALMRAEEAAGDRAAAIRHARVHEQLLRNELGAEPDPDVTAFAERLRVAPVSRVAPDPLPAESRALSLTQQAQSAPAVVSASPVPRARGSRKGSRVALVASMLVVFAAPLFNAYVLFWADPASDVTWTKSVANPGFDRTIAVLPFTNPGGDPQEEYFTDGLTEELIATLSQVRALKVAARTSVFAFKGEERDIREIGQKLNVATVLEGSVRRDGDRLRVHAQLIDASDGFHIWSDTYERQMADIFALQSELALRIADALEAKLTLAERQRLARQPTHNMEALSAYLKGRHHWTQRSGGGLALAIKYFQQAIAADSGYAKAYAGLATVYGPMGVHGFISPREGREAMRSAVLRALAIDPDLAIARTALGAYRHVYEWDFRAAEKEYQRAITMDPEESTAHLWYGYLLESTGRFEGALAHRKLVLELEPMAPIANAGVASSSLLAGRVDYAIEQFERAIRLDSTYWQGHLNMGVAYELKGQIQNAIHAYEKTAAHAGKSPKGRASLAAALARAGQERAARTMLSALSAEAESTGVHAPMVAVVYLALGESDAALAWLEQAYRQRHPDLPHFLYDPRCSILHGDPRFRDLKRRVGLTT